jgi:hypothetical protein
MWFEKFRQDLKALGIQGQLFCLANYRKFGSSRPFVVPVGEVKPPVIKQSGHS